MATNIRRATAHDDVSLEELALYRLIMDYRVGLGLPAIPLSGKLSATAGRHVLDTRENIWGAGDEPDDGANYHSWSDAPYPSDQSHPEAMWFAPQRIGTGYDAPGYEITGVGYKNGAAVLAGWKASPAHNDIITGQGAWAASEFRAIGIGAETSPGPGRFAGRVHHVWFGELPDAPPRIRGTSGADRVTGTSFDDRLQGLAGRDRLSGGPGSDWVSGGSGKDRLRGGSGDDVLHGGKGRDVLNGDAGADTFLFTRPADAGQGRLRDKIRDFDPGNDVIDMSRIDARPDMDRDQPFTFIAHGRGGAGTLHQSGRIVSGDLDGDGSADFQFTVTGGHVSADDFLL